MSDNTLPKRIVATAGELTAFAAALPPDTPVLLDEPEREPGADLSRANYAVVAAQGWLPVNDNGQICGPGEKIAVREEPDADGQVVRRLVTRPTLLLNPRYLETPGVLGERAELLETLDRLEEAFEPPADGDMTKFLMELVVALDDLRSYVTSAVTAHTGDDPRFHPAALARLMKAAARLDDVRAILSDSTRFGNVCEIARLKPELISGPAADTECDHGMEFAVMVELGPNEEEFACPAHAAAAVLQGSATIGRIKDPAARPKLLGLLDDYHLPLDDEEDQ